MSVEPRPPFRYIPHPAPTSAEARAEKLRDPGFGRVFTDHMVVVRWTDGRGWHDAEVRAREPFQIDPASAVLHYAQEIFEGLKAYRAGNGVALFRPERNAKRFQEFGRTAGHAGAAGRACSSAPSRKSCASTAIGYPAATAASICARSCSPTRLFSA